MKTPRWIASAVAGLLFAGGAIACIEALDLPKMMDRTDAAVHGTITDVRSTLFAPTPEDRRIYTILTIEGTDLYTGEARTIDAAFIGGTYQGETMNVTCMPAPGDYRLGNDVLVFSGPVEGWGPDVDRCVYAAMGGIFRTVNTPRGTVFLGKGEGTAIEKNTLKTQLLNNIQRIQRAKEVK
ncbi:MAG TPA: hypothetical protein QGG59_05095 [Planctomycetota bacterium]|jgi:hypothetical protein|nr:hypothetical protein [Planctomycetota bacterium]MDP6129313.1 hypothetical protein [Planctomycetota bacterium]MDP7244997.1 hypothetical protein [Planctomycetota bacterium]HJM39473.1 hypothetical protein [Planctomycetota bacterium]|tara:strand:+ start:81 stop:623 length:543 start_codon:yes stop_codon:yes gene_type:complete